MNRKPVRQLSPETARKIAAGEVIDRPNAIVRELLDNAVDSGADKIEVEIEGGGIEKIRISDNGCGFSKEDLAQCARPHATSKITDAQDLLKLTTLGFRGEALASMAAVSRLSVFSGNYKMRCSITEDHIIEEIPLVQNGTGSIIQTEGLFENFPARRQFLKRPATEGTMCKDTFIEKALARPDIAFRFTNDGEIKLDLPKNVSLSERFVSATCSSYPSELFFEIGGKEGDDWSFILVIGEPSIYRNDRKQIFIYVNGRRISEYSLIQAIEYGCQGFFPNGVHPVASLFVEIKSSLVDFNIHPAKKEARFKDLGSLHHGVSSAVKSFFRNWSLKNLSQALDNGNDSLTDEVLDFDFEKNKDGSETSSSSEKEQNSLSEIFDEDWLEKTEVPKIAQFKESSGTNFSSSRDRFFSPKTSFDRLRTPPLSPARDFSEKVFDLSGFQSYPSPSQNTSPSCPENIQAVSEISNSNRPDFMCDEDGFRYIGTAFKLFILCEFRGTLYIIDQHAAHERLLFDQILTEKKVSQKLLVPYKMKTDSEDEDKYLESIKEELSECGFKLEKSSEQDEENIWIISEAPIDWKGSEKDLIKDILETKVEAKEISYRLSATRACKKAVKDGYILDRVTSANIAKRALMTLKDPHCPHGRPIWTKFSRDALFEMVRRT